MFSAYVFTDFICLWMIPCNYGLLSLYDSRTIQCALFMSENGCFHQGLITQMRHCYAEMCSLSLEFIRFIKCVYYWSFGCSYPPLHGNLICLWTDLYRGSPHQDPSLMTTWGSLFLSPHGCPSYWTTTSSWTDRPPFLSCHSRLADRSLISSRSGIYREWSDSASQL